MMTNNISFLLPYASGTAGKPNNHEEYEPKILKELFVIFEYLLSYCVFKYRIEWTPFWNSVYTITTPL